LGQMWLSSTDLDISNTTATHFNALPGKVTKGFKNMKTNMPCREVDIYAQVDRKLKGVKYKVQLNKVYFYMDEEYVNDDELLHYSVFSSTDRVASVLNGTVDPVSTSYSYGDNRYQLDVSTLVDGAYLLEVRNEKNEKFYLRFIK